MQMSPANANTDGLFVPSYQQQSPVHGTTSTSGSGGIGPAMAKILEARHHDGEFLLGGEERMRRSTRCLYALLGVVLLVIYTVLLRKHFFENHGITVPSFAGESVESSKDENGSTLSVELEGSSKKKKKHKKKKKEKSQRNDDDGLFTNDAACDDGYYSKRTLKRAFELPFASLFRDTKGQKKYEASAVIVVDGEAYAVCDNSWAISKFGDDLRPFSPENIQIGDPNRQGLGGDDEDSGYESLFYNNGIFYVLRESVLHKEKGDYHAIIEELTITPDGDYDVQASCPSEFVFEGDR